MKTKYVKFVLKIKRIWIVHIVDQIKLNLFNINNVLKNALMILIYNWIKMIHANLVI